MNRTHTMARAATAAALALLACSPSFAIDLMQSYEKALQVDPTMQSANEALAAGREKAVQGDALLLPQVALSASQTYLRESSSSGLPPALANLVKSSSSGTVHQASVQLVQPIIDAKARADRQEAHQQTGLAEISFRSAQQDLLQRMGEAYFNLLWAQENLRVTQAQKAATTMQRDRAQARFDVGRGKVTELQEAQARLDSVIAREISAQSTLSLRQAQYTELTGVAVGAGASLAVLAPNFTPTPPQPDSLQAWLARGNDASLSVQSKQANLAIATADISKYKRLNQPTLDLVASYTDKGQNGGLSPLVSPQSSHATAIGVQLTVPLFAGGAIDSKHRESIAKQRQAEHDLSGARRDTRLQVQDAFLAVKNGVARIAALEQSLQSARTSLESTMLSRDVGTRTELDVLDAQQRVFDSELDLAQARNDYLLGRIHLSSAVGELREGDLRALNAYLVH